MTSKDFALIANALRRSMPEVGAPEDAQGAWVFAMLELAHALQDTDPAFDRARFIFACIGSN
jgi:hypothetical protein